MARPGVVLFKQKDLFKGHVIRMKADIRLNCLGFKSDVIFKICNVLRSWDIQLQPDILKNALNDMDDAKKKMTANAVKTFHHVFAFKTSSPNMCASA